MRFDADRPTGRLWMVAQGHLHGLRWWQSLGGEAWRQRAAMCFGSNLKTGKFKPGSFDSSYQVQVNCLSHWNLNLLDGCSKAAWIDGRSLDTPAALAFIEHTASHNLEFFLRSRNECLGLLSVWDQMKDCCWWWWWWWWWWWYLLMIIDDWCWFFLLLIDINRKIDLILVRLLWWWMKWCQRL